MRAVVIGAGHIARQHIACLKTLPGVDLAGVCDISAVTAESIADRFGIARWFTDHQRMLDEVKPDVVHITTPAPSHFRLALDALERNAHAIVEKPITVNREDFEHLRREAEQRNLMLLEDHNYLFDRSVLQILEWIDRGEFGDVVHVDVTWCLDILGPGSAFNDPNAPHPSLSVPGGAISDFLTHLSYLVYAFVGAHRTVKTAYLKRESGSALPHDEFRALVVAERGTANVLFSAHAQPDGFWLRVHGTKMRASANLFEPRLTVERMHGGPRPLLPVRNGLREAWDVGYAALAGLKRKLAGGPGSYEGLWELLARTYRALQTGQKPPVSIEQIDQVNQLVTEFTRMENRV